MIPEVGKGLYHAYPVKNIVPDAKQRYENMLRHGTRIVLRGQKPLALCDRCPCFGSLHPPLAALTLAASSIICAFDLASAVPRSPYRHLELCGIALENRIPTIPNVAGHLCGVPFTTRAQQ
ncbi:MAG: hypothetical protein KH235_01175 [Oscillospiraceae bacterium]|nr:hypothetical protein [Oscillospiraceae bacterium]